MTEITLTVNGRRVTAAVEPRTHLADFLRESQRLTGTHLGCEQGVCGACTILLDGKPARSCLTFAAACDGAEIRTVEGFGGDPRMDRLREAFSAEHALQCGFCTPGMLISAYDLVGRLPGADEARIRREMSGNLCRCTGYMGIIAAVKRVLAEGPAAVPARPAAEAQRRVPVASFAAAPVAAAPATRPAGSAADAPEVGWTRIADSFTVAQPADAVWRFFGDLPRVAHCLPGAVLEESDGTTLKGRMRVKLGPMTPSFAGTARLERDEAARSGLLEGSGGDETSNSRARGRLAYRLVPEGAGATRVELTLDFVLQGVLAQFGRSGLVRDVVGRMVQEFARNLSTALAGGDKPVAPKPAAALDTGALFWRALWARILGFLGLGR